MSCVTPNQPHTAATNRVQAETEFFPPRSLQENGLLQQEMAHNLLLAPVQPPAMCCSRLQVTACMNHRAKTTLGLLENESKGGKSKLEVGIKKKNKQSYRRCNRQECDRAVSQCFHCDHHHPAVPAIKKCFTCPFLPVCFQAPALLYHDIPSNTCSIFVTSHVSSLQPGASPSTVPGSRHVQGPMKRCSPIKPCEPCSSPPGCVQGIPLS